MRYRADRFEQHKALVGYGQVDAPYANFASDALIIALRIETEERHAETIFAASCTVAGTGVATGAGQQWHDVLAESLSAAVSPHPSPSDGVSAVKPCHWCDQFGLPIGQRLELKIVDLGQGWLGQLPLDLFGHIDRNTVGTLGDRYHVSDRRQRCSF